jgi:hypothetical protein
MLFFHKKKNLLPRIHGKKEALCRKRDAKPPPREISSSFGQLPVPRALYAGAFTLHFLCFRPYYSKARRACQEAKERTVFGFFADWGDKMKDIFKKPPQKGFVLKFFSI